MIPLRHHALIVALLLAAFFLQAALAWRLKSPTFDEPTHLAAGWSYLASGDYRLNPEHPPLLKQWAALPLLAMGLGEPKYYRGWEESHQGTFAHFLFFEGLRFERMFLAAHLMMIALATGLGLVVYRFSRELWGGDGALLSLALFAFSPNLIAHSAVVGTDFAMAGFGLLSLWTWARFLAYPSLARSTAAGVSVALVLLAKFSAVMLAPIWLGWWVLALATGGRWPAHAFRASSDPAHPLPRVDYTPRFAAPWRMEILRFWSGRFALIFSLAALLVFADYGFHLGALRAGLEHFFGHLQRGHPSFLLGEVEVGPRGWWSYFPIAYLIKTPLPESLLTLAAAGLWLKRRAGWDPWALLASPWVWVLVVAVAGRICIGYRYILLMAPLGMVMAGALLSHASARGTPTASPSPASLAKSAIALAALASLWQAAGALAVFPNHLTYFNALAGGPVGGVRWLNDSNLDWGQDLSTLGRWMADENVPRVYLSYFGTAEPRLYGVRYRRLPGYETLVRDPIVSLDKDNPAPGVYAIFATNLGGQYLADPDTYAWFRAREPAQRLGNSVFIYRVE